MFDPFNPRGHSATYQRHVSMESTSWRLRRFAAFALTWGRDAVCPLLPAQDAAHLTYRHLGSELPIRDIVPLNRAIHRIVDDLRANRQFAPVVNAYVRLSFLAWMVGELWLTWTGVHWISHFLRLPGSG
jgi:hypothetical protein